MSAWCTPAAEVAGHAHEPLTNKEDEAGLESVCCLGSMPNSKCIVCFQNASASDVAFGLSCCREHSVCAECSVWLLRATCQESHPATSPCSASAPASKEACTKLETPKDLARQCSPSDVADILLKAEVPVETVVKFMKTHCSVTEIANALLANLLLQEAVEFLRDEQSWDSVMLADFLSEHEDAAHLTWYLCFILGWSNLKAATFLIERDRVHEAVAYLTEQGWGSKEVARLLVQAGRTQEAAQLLQKKGWSADKISLFVFLTETCGPAASKSSAHGVARLSDYDGDDGITESLPAAGACEKAHERMLVTVRGHKLHVEVFYQQHPFGRRQFARVRWLSQRNEVVVRNDATDRRQLLARLAGIVKRRKACMARLPLHRP